MPPRVREDRPLPIGRHTTLIASEDSAQTPLPKMASPVLAHDRRTDRGNKQNSKGTRTCPSPSLMRECDASPSAGIRLEQYPLKTHVCVRRDSVLGVCLQTYARFKTGEYVTEFVASLRKYSG